MVIKNRFKKVAIIGAGIFGCTIAIVLKQAGYDVTLFEKSTDIFTGATHINQYRLHRGYHYPRSIETMISSKKGVESFVEFFGEDVLDNNVEHYYAISKKDSLISATEYLSILDFMGLEYSKTDLSFINSKSVELVIKVKENLFNFFKLKEKVKERLNILNVNLQLNKNVNNITDLETQFNHIIIATYVNNNLFLKTNQCLDYQFELCEKPVVKMPKIFKNKSVVVMDGPFMCFDPLLGTPYHLMGSVNHAIHSRNIGKFPLIPKTFEDFNLLNNGIIEAKKIKNLTKVNLFFDSAKEYFPQITESMHIGSMFTFRTVLPNREHDDFRPTLVTRIDSKITTVFSGKIVTSVDAAKEVLQILRGD